jgi:hypothetical protein
MLNEEFVCVHGEQHRVVGPALFTVDEFIDELLDAAREVHTEENVFFDDEGEPLQDFSDVDTFDLKLTKTQFLTAAARAAELVDRFCCLLCGVDTLEIGEMYCIHNDLWMSCVRGKGMLCIGCLERVLGRQLTPADFADFPINTLDYDDNKSERLRDRLGIPPPNRAERRRANRQLRQVNP